MSSLNGRVARLEEIIRPAGERLAVIDSGGIHILGTETLPLNSDLSGVTIVRRLGQSVPLSELHGGVFND
jgi:hypothetical protein